MNAQHFSTEELADAADGLREPERATAAESHTAHCATARAQSDALRQVTTTLVTVVTGCGAGTPSTGPSAVVPP